MVLHSKKKILIFHFDMQGGDAEKVLINLLQHLDYSKYDITLHTIFGAGVNMKDIPQEVHVKYVFKKVFRGFSSLMKLLPPKFWHWLFIKDKYDLEIAYLESSPTRIISGGNKKTKKIAWVHTTLSKDKKILKAFRNDKEATMCYNKFERIVFVSNNTLKEFCKCLPNVKSEKIVIHNVNDYDRIYKKAIEPCPLAISPERINIIAIGRLIKLKRFDRIIQAISQLKKEGISNIHFYLLGKGNEQENLSQLIKNKDVVDQVSMLGFDNNPYKWIAKMDLFVCSSEREGYSTATSEAVALGIPVLTTKVSGMDEILKNGKFGLIVENNDNDFYHGLKTLVSNPRLISKYKKTISQQPKPTTQSLIENYENLFDNI